MKKAFAICFMFVGLQSVDAIGQEVTAPPVPPQSCDAPRFNPSLSFLHAPEAAFDEGLTTASIAAAPAVSNVPNALPVPPKPEMKKASQLKKKHRKQKKTAVVLQ